jgi:predicted negative regulator of RcsB-dependent stress response
MELNVDKKIEFKDKLNSFYSENKLKMYIAIIIVIFSIISVNVFNINKEKKNELIAEKYIQAGLLLSSKNQEKSKKIYEEIILSENNFYSILSLNTILEENLITDKNKILEYFSIVEKLTKSNDQLDLIFFKKALFLIEKKEITEGKAILEKIIGQESKYKFLAKEVLEK